MRVSRTARPMAVLVGTLMAVAACGPAATSTTTPSTTTTATTPGATSSAGAEASGAEPITMEWWGAATDPPVYEALAAEFNKTHKNQIKLTILPILEYVPKVVAAAAGGSLPDILTVDLIYMPTSSTRGCLSPSPTRSPPTSIGTS